MLAVLVLVLVLCFIDRVRGSVCSVILFENNTDGDDVMVDDADDNEMDWFAFNSLCFTYLPL